MSWKKWSESENDLLRILYLRGDRKEIISALPGRTWASIIAQATQKLGLKRDNPQKLSSYVDGKSKLLRLLEDTPEAYYWAGMLTADGHYDPSLKRLIMALSVKDREHLEKLCGFVNSKSEKLKVYNQITSFGGGASVRFELADADVVPKFAEKFGWSDYKTFFFDPKIEEKPDVLFLSFLAGFIDGDGWVYRGSNNSTTIGICAHENLKPVFDKWANKFYEMFSVYIHHGTYPVIRPSRYGSNTKMVWWRFNGDPCAALKKELLGLNLPLLNRKWSRIDEMYVSRYKRKSLKKDLIHDFS